MRLVVSPNEFHSEPYLTKAADELTVLGASMDYFDKDGYELNRTEQVYYVQNGVNISEHHLYHVANHVSWFLDLDFSELGCVLDHSTIVTRWEYTEAAREQVWYLTQDRPLMNKLLGVRKKWGIDFSLDFVYPGGAMEIFHIESDYLDYTQALEDKTRAEELILSTDWTHAVKSLVSHRDQWEHLGSDDQSDWKAKFLGWHRAFDNRKVFV